MTDFARIATEISPEIIWAKSVLTPITSTPQLEAELLLAFVCGGERHRLYLQKSLSQTQQSRFRNLLMRRACFEPLAYLTGTKEFYSLDFQVDARVLIPRADTEGLVDLGVEELRNHPDIHTLMDVGVGSGALLISVLSEFPERPWLAVGCDTSQDALALAQINVKRLLPSGMNIQMLAPSAAQRRGPFEVVLANPPYLSFQEWLDTPPDVHLYEPELALIAEKSFIQWVTELSHSVIPGGKIFMEWGDFSKQEKSTLQEQLQRIGVRLQKLIHCQPKCHHLVLEKL